VLMIFIDFNFQKSDFSFERLNFVCYFTSNWNLQGLDESRTNESDYESRELSSLEDTLSSTYQDTMVIREHSNEDLINSKHHFINEPIKWNFLKYIIFSEFDDPKDDCKEAFLMHIERNPNPGSMSPTCVDKEEVLPKR